MSAQNAWDDIFGQHNVPAKPAPAVENVELWAKRGSLAAVRFDQMDNETSVIDSRTLRLLLVRAGYQHVSAHQKEDT